MPDPLHVGTLHHLAITSRRPAECSAFYRDVLGFEVLPRPKFSFDGAWLRKGPLELHIIQHESADGRRGKVDSLARHFAMAVQDLDACEARLRQHGLDYKRQVNAAGFQQIFFQDPDGNHVEVGIYPER